MIDVNAKNRNKSAILKKKFQPLLNLPENWLLVTCITILERIHGKIIGNADADAAEVQLQ